MAASRECTCGADHSHRNERSHNLRYWATIVSNITYGNVVSSGVAENTPEDFFPVEQEIRKGGLSKATLLLCSESIPVSLAEINRIYRSEG